MNVVNLNTNTVQTDLKIVNIPHYQTTDGSIFTSEFEASEHQALINKAEEFVQKSRGKVYGITMRGFGTEYVDASHRSMFNYTMSILKELKEDNKLLSLRKYSRT